MSKEKTCGELVVDKKNSTMATIKNLWESYCKGEEYCEEEETCFHEYGLGFWYNEGDDGEPGFFTYQICWGGPSEELRFFVNPDLSVYKIQFWYLDWFDGASLNLYGEDLEVATEIFNFFEEIGSVQAEFDKFAEY